MTASLLILLFQWLLKQFYVYIYAMTNPRYKAVIFDRDGTLNRTTNLLRSGQLAGAPTDGYVLHPTELELLPQAAQAITILRRNSVLPFVFTQQNCIAKGLVTLADVEAIHTHMNALLGPEAQIEAFYIASSPQHARAKPSPVMIEEILQAYDLSAHEVVVLGDSLRDCKAAQAAGVDFIWIKDDLGRVSQQAMLATGYPIYDDVLSAVTERVIIKRMPSLIAPRH